MGDVQNAVSTLTGVDYAYITGSFIVVISAIKALSGLFEWFLSKTGLTTKNHEQKILDKQMVLNHESEIEQLKKHDVDIEESIKNVSDMVNMLNSKIDAMQDKEDATERAKLKDRIGESYRIYHDRQWWTSMEKEAFYDLIRRYEHHGGTNSFVHQKCEPESYTWEVVD